MNAERNIVVEFLLSNGEKNTQTIHINHGESRPITTICNEYIDAYQKGLEIERFEADKIANMDAEKQKEMYDYLKKYWNNISSQTVVAHLFKNRSVSAAPVLWQENAVSFLYSAIINLQTNVPDISKILLKIKKGSESKRGDLNRGLDDQLFATFLYNHLYGIRRVECECSDDCSFDVDFSFIKDKEEYLIQVKSLMININNKVREQFSILQPMRKALEAKGVYSKSFKIDGIIPNDFLHPQFDWNKFFNDHDIGEPIILSSSSSKDGEDKWGATIRIIDGDTGSMSGIDPLKFLKTKLNGVSGKIVCNTASRSKHVVLLVVPYGTVMELNDQKEKIFKEWSYLNLDGVIIMEYCWLSTGEGVCKYEVFEQFKNSAGYWSSYEKFILKGD